MAAHRRPKQLPYREGDWFSVPLRTGGYGLGVAARLSGEGPVFGYFYGPKTDAPPTIEAAANLRPENAVLRTVFGDLGLLEGTWKVLGRIDAWRRSEWPMPALCRYHPDLHPSAYCVEYDEKTFAAVREWKVEPAHCLLLPRDGLSGYGAVEIQLAKILGLSGEAQQDNPADVFASASLRQIRG